MGPSIAVMFLQPHCNMTCTFCVTEDAFDAISFAAAVDLLDHLVERGFGSVVFGGGEPFVWPGDVVALARQARQRGLWVQVGTNGVALPEGFATLDCIDRFVLPLESTDPSVHNAMRQHRQGHHALVLRRLTELQRVARSVTVSTVVTATNAAGIQALAAWLRDYVDRGGNLHAWHLYQFLPLGRGGRANGAQLSIPAEDYVRICDAVRALDLPFTIYQRTDMYRPTSVEFFWAKDGAVVRGSEALHCDCEARTAGTTQVL